MKTTIRKTLLFALGICIMVLGITSQSWAYSFVYYTYDSSMENPQSSQSNPIFAYAPPPGVPFFNQNGDIYWGADINNPNSLSSDPSYLGYWSFTHQQGGDFFPDAVNTYRLGYFGLHKVQYYQIQAWILCILLLSISFWT